MVAVLAILTACTNPPSDQVATAESSATPTNSTSTPDPRRFAACLRERGIDVPDPGPGEQVELQTKDDKTRAALRACAQYAPPREQEEDSVLDPAASRAFAQCIREHGFPDFPDPDEQGPRIPKDLIHDERYTAAERECAHFLNEDKGSKQ